MRRKHNGKIYFPHYEETRLADTRSRWLKVCRKLGIYITLNGTAENSITATK